MPHPGQPCSGGPHSTFELFVGNKTSSTFTSYPLTLLTCDSSDASSIRKGKVFKFQKVRLWLGESDSVASRVTIAEETARTTVIHTGSVRFSEI